MSVGKVPQQIAMTDLQPGDVIIFQAARSTKPKVRAAQAIIKALQRAFSKKQKFGLDESTHVGICVGKDENGQPLIAAVTESGGKFGYQVLPLDKILENDGMTKGRPLQAFRANDQSIREKIVYAIKTSTFQNTTWSFGAIRKMFSKPTNKNADLPTDATDIEVQKETLCSIIATQALQAVGLLKGQTHQLSPKGLESNLHQSPHFTLYNCPMPNVLDKTRDVLFEAFKNEKINISAAELEKLQERLDKIDPNDTLQKSYALLAAYWDQLPNEKSQDRVLNQLKSVGIYKRDYDSYCELQKKQPDKMLELHAAAGGSANKFKDKFDELKHILKGVENHCTKNQRPIPKFISGMNKVLNNPNNPVLGEPQWEKIIKIANKARVRANNSGNALHIEHAHMSSDKLYQAITDSRGGGVDKLINKIAEKYDSKPTEERVEYARPSMK